MCSGFVKCKIERQLQRYAQPKFKAFRIQAIHEERCSTVLQYLTATFEGSTPSAAHFAFV